MGTIEEPRLRVILGLGNPGLSYATTRHNVGWWFVEYLAELWGLAPWQLYQGLRATRGRVGKGEVLLIEPLTYMNRSGDVLDVLDQFEGFEPRRDLLVVVDDIALPPGRIRLRAKGSAGGHNGLRSIEAALGTEVYPRLRIGVGSPPPGVGLVDWVLSPMPAEDEESVLEQFPRMAEGVELWIGEGIEAAMRRLNR